MDETEMVEQGELLAEVIGEAQRRFRFVIDRALAHIVDSDNPELAAWQVAYALGSPCCLNSSMTTKASQLGVGKAAVSKGATGFCRAVDLPPSHYMLSESARKSYRQVRDAQETARRAGC